MFNFHLLTSWKSPVPPAQLGSFEHHGCLGPPRCIWDDFSDILYPSFWNPITFITRPKKTGRRLTSEATLTAFKVTISQTLHVCEGACGTEAPWPRVSRGGSAKNLLHMVGRDPNNTVCVAKRLGVLIYSSTLCGLLPSTRLMWSLCGCAVRWWTCHEVFDLSSFLPLEDGAPGGLRLLRSPRRLPSPQKWCQDNAGRGRSVRLGTSCENSKQLSGQICATRPLRRAGLRLLRCRCCLFKMSVVTPSVGRVAARNRPAVGVALACDIVLPAAIKSVSAKSANLQNYCQCTRSVWHNLRCYVRFGNRWEARLLSFACKLSAFSRLLGSQI